MYNSWNKEKFSKLGCFIVDVSMYVGGGIPHKNKSKMKI